jgi:hypothetical protein
MPRRSSGTGNVLPVPSLDIEEVKFWLHIMEDHALFIKTGLPFDKPDLIEEASTFEREFKALRVRAEKSQVEKKFAELIADTMSSLKEFIKFKILLLGLSLTNKLGSALPPLFFDHIIREAEYFMAILEKIRAGKKLAVVKALEADFWLRIMAEHTKFIGSRLDPSEISMIDVVRGYQDEFDDLTMQGWDYVSFFEHKSSELPAFNRFLQDSRAATVRLRDFEQATYDMIINNRLLSTISAVMADHVRRETDHFLLVLAMIEKGVIKIEKDCVDVKYKNHTKFGILVDEEVAEDAGENIETANYIKCNEFVEREHVLEEDAVDDIELDCTPDNDEREKIVTNTDSVEQKVNLAEDMSSGTKAKYQVKTAIVPDVEVAVRPEPENAPKTDKNGKKSKYKWGENWPRQLGKQKV